MPTGHAAMYLPHAYSSDLVVLSLIVGIIASYTAFGLARCVTTSKGGSQIIWLLGGAATMGLGVWALHFIAMLAFSLPVPISYNMVITLVSMVPAIIAAAIALHVASRPEMGAFRLLIGSVLMGVGVGAMHYTGMEAIQVDGTLSYDISIVLASVVIAVIVSAVAMWLSFSLRGAATNIGMKLGGAVVMAGGIFGLHYVAMTAAQFTPTDPAMLSRMPTAAAGSSWLAMVITVIMLVILALAFVAESQSDKQPSVARIAR